MLNMLKELLTLLAQRTTRLRRLEALKITQCQEDLAINWVELDDKRWNWDDISEHTDMIDPLRRKNAFY
jgi:hypothetical protein